MRHINQTNQNETQHQSDQSGSTSSIHHKKVQNLYIGIYANDFVNNTSPQPVGKHASIELPQQNKNRFKTKHSSAWVHFRRVPFLHPITTVEPSRDILLANIINIPSSLYQTSSHLFSIDQSNLRTRPQPSMLEPQLIKTSLRIFLHPWKQIVSVS